MTVYRKKLSRLYYPLIWTVVGSVLCSTLGACSQPLSIALQKIVSNDDGKNQNGNNNPGNGNTEGNSVQRSLLTIQPSLAVRGTGCLMCHASIQGNIVTDFGYGDPWFMGMGGATENGVMVPAGQETGAKLTYYGDYMGSFESASISQGSVYVPAIHVSMPSLSLDLGLADFVKSLNNASFISPVAGQAAVIGASKVTIGAPSQTAIANLMPSSASGAKFALINMSANGKALSGLQSVNSKYVTNSSTSNFVCYGDVVVTQPLFLNNVTIDTDSTGCHLYVSSSVFIQGPITYVSAAGTTPNLQISSSRLIALGFDPTSLSNRMCINNSSGRQWVSPYRLTRGLSVAGTVSPIDKANDMIADANLIVDSLGNNLLIDADVKTGPVVSSIDHVLLNAPEVESRYVAPFNGVVIAEISIFRLQQFNFKFDSVFAQVPVLPAFDSTTLSGIFDLEK